jgi:hypothetical protein
MGSSNGKHLHYTGIDPFTKKPVTVAKGLRDCNLQRALIQFSKPANYFEVREPLLQTGRGFDRQWDGCDCLIPANPPKEALEAKRKRANAALTNADHYHTVPTPGKIAATARDGKRKPGRRRQQRIRPDLTAKEADDAVTGSFSSAGQQLLSV